MLSGLKRRFFGGGETKPAQSSSAKRIKRSYEGVVKVRDVVDMLRGIVAVVDATSGSLNMVEVQELVENLVNC